MMAPDNTRSAKRRWFLQALAGSSVAGVLAGCLGDGSSGGSGDGSSGGNGDGPSGGSGDGPSGGNGGDATDEIDAKAEQALQQKEAADGTIQSALDRARLHNDWEGCLGAVEEVPDRLDAARQNAQDALELAVAGEHTDRVKALEVLIEIIDLLEEATTEVRSLCEAGLEGNRAEVNRRYDTLAELSDELERKEAELARITDGDD